jgi:hypothetical protein
MRIRWGRACCCATVTAAAAADETAPPTGIDAAATLENVREIASLRDLQLIEIAVRKGMVGRERRICGRLSGGDRENPPEQTRSRASLKTLSPQHYTPFLVQTGTG